MFDYKQRPPDNRKEFDERWEKIFSGKYKGMMSKKQFDKEIADSQAQYDKDFAETTEQKQPLVK